MFSKKTGQKLFRLKSISHSHSHSCSSFYSPFLPFLSFSWMFFFSFFLDLIFGYILFHKRIVCESARAYECVLFFSFVQETIFFIRINNGRSARQAKWVHCLFSKWKENKFSNVSVKSVFRTNLVRSMDLQESDLNFSTKWMAQRNCEKPE